MRPPPHHVELVQAQSVNARPLAIHRLPEGLKEQVLWRGKRPGVIEEHGGHLGTRGAPVSGNAVRTSWQPNSGVLGREAAP